MIALARRKRNTSGGKAATG